ncbi:MAG: tetratricopeptide repeat protein [Ignavibacteriales bacterium]|nr:tetratricopeptide repeat protein [Ignavibacteriales bacterium]
MSKKKSHHQNIKKNKKKNEQVIKSEEKKDYSKLLPFLSFVAVSILGILIYSNTIRIPFYFDDLDSVVRNPLIKNLQNFTTLPAILDLNPRFISYLSFALNFHYGGLDVMGYHLINILIHLINTFLVMYLTHLTLCTPLLKDKYDKQAKTLFIFMVGLVFVAHPIQTQTVNYIVQRMTSLATLFYLLSLCSYIKAKFVSANVSINIIIRYGLIVLLLAFSLLAAIMGLWSKQIVVTLPLIVILYEVMFLRNRENKIYWKTVIGLSLFLLISIILVLFKIGLPIEADGTPRSVYLLTQINVLVTYIKLLILPINLNFDYDFPFTYSLLDTRTIIDLVILLAIIFIAIKFAKRNRLVSFSILWFFITISVESSIIPIRDVIVEQRLYLPMFGFSLLLISLVFLFIQKYRIPALFLFSCLILCYSILTYQRNSLWNDPIAMWTDVIRQSPDKLRPNFYRGFAYLHNNEIDLAINDFKNVIAKYPKYYLAYDNLGLAYQEKKDYRTAIKYHDEAIQINPDNPIAYNNRALAFIFLGDYDKSIDDLNKAVGLNNQYDDAFYNLGYVYFLTKKHENAIKYFLKAFELNPTYTDIYNYLGYSYNELGDYKKAKEQVDLMRSKGITPNPRLLKRLKL